MSDTSSAHGTSPAPTGDERTPGRVGPNEVLRFFIELFAFFSLCFWGFVAWPFPWNIVVGIVAPALAVLVWALFRSPKAVIRIDPFGRAFVEAVVMLAAAFAWWDLGQPIIAGMFTLVFLVSGIINGLREMR